MWKCSSRNFGSVSPDLAPKHILTLKSHIASKRWKGAVLDICPLSIPPWLALHGWLGSCSFPVPGQCIQVSGDPCSCIYTPALNMPKKPSPTLRPVGKEQPAATLFPPDHSDYTVNRESPNSPLSHQIYKWFGLPNLTQTMTVSGIVVMI